MFRLGDVPVLLLRSTPQTRPRTGTVPRYFSLQLRFLLQGIHFDNHWGLLLLLLLTEVLHDANPKVPSRYLRRTLLHLAAAFSESAVILLYKRFGAELAVNAVDEENNTPLHLACNEKVVLHLLMGGADWSAQNKRGQFPSQTAAPAARQVLRTDSPCTLLLGMLLSKVLTQPGGGGEQNLSTQDDKLLKNRKNGMQKLFK